MAMDLVFANRLLASFTDDATTISEMALVARAKTGDHHAFEVLVRKYRGRVLNVVWRIVSDADAAQDVAQETFIRAYQQLPRFRGKSKFGTWLYRIAVNEARGHLRALDQLLAGESVSADEALVNRIMAQVQEADILRKWRRRWLLDSLGPIAAALSLGAAMIVIVQPHAAEWTAALSTWQLDWELLAEPQWALGAVVGLPLVAGGVAWLTNWLAEALT